MCDTMVALPDVTQDGSVLFAKNSDRDPNEAHFISHVPAARHEAGSTVQCTYIEIPQIGKTNAVLLAKPFWIWGAEMGANEHGVVIGNEAVFSKVPAGKAPGLIGMDYLRLGLERARSAEEALHVITDLLGVYGQSGNCGYTHPLYYHNSYLIADRESAWVLETVDRHWMAQRVEGLRSISNAITIGKKWDLASADVIHYALDKGWCKSCETFDFSRCYSDLIYTTFSDGRRRQQCTSGWLKDMSGKISVKNMIQILRSHRDSARIDRSVSGQDVCAHAGFGPIRISQTTGSMVSHLRDGIDTHWVTGTSTPCAGIFKPLWLDAGLPDMGPVPGRAYDENSLWWQHEMLHREIMLGYQTRMGAYIEHRDQLENEFLQMAQSCHQEGAEERNYCSESCFSRAGQANERWLGEVQGTKPTRKPAIFHRMAWRHWNKEAKISIPSA